MNHNEVIKFPILTEKSYKLMDNNVYTFAVDKRTNKSEVKKVIEFIFEVKVSKVNIFTVPKKAKKLGRFEGFTNGYKKAMVTLKDGSVINIFPEEAIKEAEAKAKTKEVEADVKSNEPSEAEKKAAEKIKAKLAEKEAKPEVKKETTETK